MLDPFQHAHASHIRISRIWRLVFHSRKGYSLCASIPPVTVYDKPFSILDIHKFVKQLIHGVDDHAICYRGRRLLCTRNDGGV